MKKSPGLKRFSVFRQKTCRKEEVAEAPSEWQQGIVKVPNLKKKVNVFILQEKIEMPGRNDFWDVATWRRGAEDRLDLIWVRNPSNKFSEGFVDVGKSEVILPVFGIWEKIGGAVGGLGDGYKFATHHGQNKSPYQRRTGAPPNTLP